MKGKTMTKVDLNKFCKFTDEIDSILSNVLEKITKFEKDNDIEAVYTAVQGFSGALMAKMQAEAQLEQMKAQLDAQKQAQEVEYKKQLMELEFNMNMQLKQMEVQAVNGKEKEKEDRKDKRTKIQASQQSELIDQRKNEKPPKNFESAGNDNMGGFDLGSFEPR